MTVDGCATLEANVGSNWFDENFGGRRRRPHLPVRNRNRDHQNGYTVITLTCLTPSTYIDPDSKRDGKYRSMIGRRGHSLGEKSIEKAKW